MTDAILYWNMVALNANKESHTHDHMEHTGPPLSARALALVHLAMYDACIGQETANGVAGLDSPYLPVLELPAATAGNSTDAAIAGAAHTTLSSLFPSQSSYFDSFAAHTQSPTLAGGWDYGVAVATKLLMRVGPPADVSNLGYTPSADAGRWRPDPDNSAQKAHGPTYGKKSKLFATSKRYVNAPPPAVTTADGEYLRAFRQVRSKGIKPSRLDSVSDLYDLHTVVAGDTLGAIAQRFYGDSSLFPRIFEANRHLLNDPDTIFPGQVLRIPTSRTLDETVAGIFWGYDGAVGLGTPPRLYNQIVRQVAVAKGNTLGENARLFALVNVAMADAGILSWEQKYVHDYWRPVTGIREHGASLGAEGVASATISNDADPWWLPLGAPNTNTLRRHPFNPGAVKNFTPPFPAYPSGHATFGAAALHMTRLFYKTPPGNRQPDKHFQKAGADMGFVSDEFNGENYDNTDTLRPQHTRKFMDGLWGMIEENSRSRVFLGVHWVFDGFAVTASNEMDLDKDVDLDNAIAGVGGVPLGLAIAEDIFATGMLASVGEAAGLPATPELEALDAAELSQVAGAALRQPWPLG